MAAAVPPEECPPDGWCFVGEGSTVFRSFEWVLKVFSTENKFEYSYTTIIKGIRASLHRRGHYEVAGGRLFCTVEGKIRITRGNGPPSVTPDPVRGHEQLVFDFGDGVLTSDEATPMEAKLVLKPLEVSRACKDLLDFRPPEREDDTVFPPVEERPSVIEEVE